MTRFSITSMHIAFVSYEYPPDTADGGIATYVRQAAQMLAARGHHVEVFCASRTRSGSSQEDGLSVHRVQTADRLEFAGCIAPVFAERHRAAPFDLLEGTDYNADARTIPALSPEVALVIRLHTPTYLAAALHRLALESGGQGGATADWREWLRPLPGYDPDQDPECIHARQADRLTAPSQAIRDLICRDWQIDPAGVDVIPNVYHPARALLELPLETVSREIAYIGRLQLRKGVLPLAQAIPLVLQEFPGVRFQFVGRPLGSPEPGVDMQVYLQRLLRPHAEAVSFPGPVDLERIPEVLSRAAICVFPSLWENFPYVCLEAMAAGRAIVGSEAGGMAEMLQEGAGLLVSPDRPDSMAAAILSLLQDPELRKQIGRKARERVNALYDSARIAPLQETSYQRALDRKKHRWLNTRP